MSAMQADDEGQGGVARNSSDIYYSPRWSSPTYHLLRHVIELDILAGRDTPPKDIFTRLKTSGIERWWMMVDRRNPQNVAPYSFDDDEGEKKIRHAISTLRGDIKKNLDLGGFDEDTDIVAQTLKLIDEHRDKEIAKIKRLDNMDAFIEAFEAGSVSSSLGRIRRARQKGEKLSVDKWDMEWALRMRGKNSKLQDCTPDEHRCAYSLNVDRKICLQLLYQLYKCVVEHECIPIDAVVNGFQHRRAKTILQLCLPMDRANCLYKMQYDQTINEYGMHWYADRDVNDPNRWGEQGPPAGITIENATINKKLIWLVEDVQGLKLEEVRIGTKEVSDYLKPEKVPPPVNNRRPRTQNK